MLQQADLADSTTGVLGFVHGSAVNQDGRSSSLTAPNGPAQTALVRAALTAAGAQPAAVSFVSVHGTGAACKSGRVQHCAALALGLSSVLLPE